MFDQELIAGLDRYISPRLIVEKGMPLFICHPAIEVFNTQLLHFLERRIPAFQPPILRSEENDRWWEIRFKGGTVRDNHGCPKCSRPSSSSSGAEVPPRFIWPRFG